MNLEELWPGFCQKQPRCELAKQAYRLKIIFTEAEVINTISQEHDNWEAVVVKKRQ